MCAPLDIVGCGKVSNARAIHRQCNAIVDLKGALVGLPARGPDQAARRSV